MIHSFHRSISQSQISYVPFQTCGTVPLLQQFGACADPQGTSLLIGSICLPTLPLCEHAALCSWKNVQRQNIFRVQIIRYCDSMACKRNITFSDMIVVICSVKTPFQRTLLRGLTSKYLTLYIFKYSKVETTT